jgi:DNA polymerase-3 subunit delta
MDSLSFLERMAERAAKAKIQPVYVLHGDEAFLKRQVQAGLKPLVLGNVDHDFATSTHPGDKAVWSAVHDELETLPFLAPRRLVLVENAEPFVTRHRSALEKYLAAPAATGVLVLEVNSWPSNTRLARLLPDSGVIACKALSANRLPEWCVAWASSRHGKQLAAAAARLLVDLIGTDMGLLDQELAKLAVYVGENARIEAADVDALVGNSRAEKTWEIFDLIGAGKAGEALTFLQRLLDQGEDPMRLLGAFSLQLRRLAQAARGVARGETLASALEEAGVLPFAVRAAEAQLRHLGRRRAERLYDWLLETDLGLKGGSQLPPRTLLERLVVRLAAPRSPASSERSA